MNLRIGSLALGLALGVGLMLTIGAKADKTAGSAGWDRLKLVAYPNGVTGIFDPASGKLYMYASNLENCFAVYLVETLGLPLAKTNP